MSGARGIYPAMVCDYINSGSSVREIAARLRCSTSIVRRQLKAAGIHLSKQQRAAKEKRV